ncbi:MAG: AAA family ATPase [Spirochaetes bacterium]|jgi:chromosome partitioning protein|nr:AAA family ATPase [Spirochaetota bacterium]
MSPRVICVSNFKGGIGKTTTSIHLAEIMSQNYKVLLIDTDPQANLTSFYDVDFEGLKKNNLLTALDNGNVKKSIWKLSDSLDILPATIHLADFESRFANEAGKELIMKDLIEKLKYDRIIIDCPPSMGIITRNVIFASDTIVIPVDPESWSVEAALTLVSNIENFKTSRLKRELSLDRICILPVKIGSLSIYDKKFKAVINEYFGNYPILPAISTHAPLKKQLNDKIVKRSGKVWNEYKHVCEVINENS